MAGSEGPEFDFTPRAQVPLSGAQGQTAATHALASMAYRDSSVDKLIDANSDWAKSDFKKGRLSLFEPNLGEAFARAVTQRMLADGRKPLIQSFGMEPQAVLEHCLAANRYRKERDTRLTVVMGVFGLLFLPGVLVWLGAFQLRRTLAGASDKRVGAVGYVLLGILGLAAIYLFLTAPLGGLLGVYLRGLLIAPIIGWFWASRICEKYAKGLHEHWTALLAGGGLGAKIPEAVPSNPGEASAERLRLGLAKLSAEQHSNVVFYAGPKGILGMGTRWGAWHLAEDLKPKESGGEIHPFRSWDVVKAVHDQLRMLERTPLHTGGFPAPAIKHWIVAPIGEGAGEVARPGGTVVDGYSVRDFEVQRICNEQQFGAGNRHYLGVQFTLWDGQLVITMMISVTVLHETLRIEVTGHALGPVHPLFTSKPGRPSKTVSGMKFWETREKPLPLVPSREVVRLAARAPFTWYPPLLDDLGGKLKLPEPFGLRHVWADKMWRHRFMADDVLRAAPPVLRVVHAAALRVLEENNVDTTNFAGRSLALSGMVQSAEPRQADVYNA